MILVKSYSRGNILSGISFERPHKRLQAPAGVFLPAPSITESRAVYGAPSSAGRALAVDELFLGSSVRLRELAPRAETIIQRGPGFRRVEFVSSVTVLTSLEYH